MNPILKFALGGPFTALLRYGVSAGGVYLIGKGIPEGIVQQTGAYILAIVPALVGMIGATTSTRAATLLSSDKIVSVKTSNGFTLRNPDDVKDRL